MMRTRVPRCCCEATTARRRSRPSRTYSAAAPTVTKKVTLRQLYKKHERCEPITMVTAYDYPTAQVVSARSEVDMILVGDSVGMTTLGYTSTVPVTLEDMEHHARAVARGAQRPFLVGDLPFGSYEQGEAQAVASAVRLLKCGMESVKLEGGRDMAKQVRALDAAGISVLGHIGLTPQTAVKLGGYGYQGKTAKAALRLVDDALALQEAGAIALVVECVPAEVAAEITARLRIPTIGIGSGKRTSGQVLVLHDMIGLYAHASPKLAKRYTNVSDSIAAALATYASEVRGGVFPGPENCCVLAPQELAALKEALPPRETKPTSDNEAAEAKKTASAAQRRADAKRVLVIGAGAVGSLLAAKLAKADHDVTIVDAWEAHIAAVKRRGLSLATAGAKAVTAEHIEALSPAEFEASAAQRAASYDVVIVATKGGKTGEALAQVPSVGKCRAASAPVVVAVNGLLKRDVFKRVFGDAATVVHAITYNGALLTGPGEVSHTGVGETLLEGGSEPLQALFSEAGIASRNCKSEEAKEAAWRKLVVNLAINPLTAAMGVKNGVIAGEAWRPAVTSLVREALAARGDVASSAEELKKHVDEVVKVAQATQANSSSMLCDVERGASTEHDHFMWSARQLNATGSMPLQSFLKELMAARQATKV